MKTLIILNHQLTNEQVLELGGECRYLTTEQKALWANIPADGDAQRVRDHLAPIFVEIANSDRVVCQGESTAFAQVLRLCDMWGMPVLVACSTRDSMEVSTMGESTTQTVKTSIFRHAQFRRV